MRIRPGTIQDCDRITILCAQLGYSTTLEETESRLSELLQRSDHAIFVAEQSDQVVGWIHAEQCKLVIIDPLVLILGIVVDEQFRAQGIGRSLLQHVEAWAVSQNCSTVMARSNSIRIEAHRFYEQVGYQRVKQSIVFEKGVS